MAGATAAVPRAAEAQARGTLQVAAVVVNTAPGLEAIKAANRIVRQSSGVDSHRSDSVATLANVTILTPRGADSVVVTVEYAKN